MAIRWNDSRALQRCNETREERQARRMDRAAEVIAVAVVFAAGFGLGAKVTTPATKAPAKVTNCAGVVK